MKKFQLFSLLLLFFSTFSTQAAVTSISVENSRIKLPEIGRVTVVFKAKFKGTNPIDSANNYTYIDIKGSNHQDTPFGNYFYSSSGGFESCTSEFGPGLNCQLPYGQIGEIEISWSGSPKSGTYPFLIEFEELEGRDDLEGGSFSETVDSQTRRFDVTFEAYNPGILEFEKFTYEVDEDAGPVRLAVQRVGGSSGELIGNYRTEEEINNNPAPGLFKATEGKDFQKTNGSVKWSDGESGKKFISIPITQDSLKEPTELFYLRIINEESGEDTLAEIHIKDKYVEPEFGSIRIKSKSQTVKESDRTTKVIVERINGSDGKVTVKYKTGASGDTAEKNKDYDEGSGTLTWNDGDSNNKEIKLSIRKDKVKESDESFTVSLSAATGGATLDAQNSAKVTIKDTTNFGNLGFKVDKSSFKEDQGKVSVQVVRLDGSDGAVSIKYKTGSSSDSAIADKDYIPVNGTLNWADGDNKAKSISIELLRDIEKEPDEVATLQLESPTGGAKLSGNKTMNLTIKDTTSFGALSFKSSNLTAAEDQGTVNFEVQRTDGSDGAVSIKYRTGDSEDSATAGADYKSTNGTLNWANGDSKPKQIKLELLRDTIREQDEVVTLILESPGGNAEVGQNKSTKLTIKDATDFGSISFSKDRFTGREDAGTIPITLKRVGGTDGDISVRVTSGDNTDSAEAGKDYTALNTVVNWTNGDGSDKTVSLIVSEDDDIESDESVTLKLTESTGGAIIGNPDTSAVDIENTTLPKFGGFGFAVPNQSALEGSGNLQLIVQRRGGSDGPVSVSYQIGVEGDTATLDEDYSASPLTGELVWGDKDSSDRTIDLKILIDFNLEGDETLTIALSNPVGGAELTTDATSIISIRDALPADFAPVLSIVSGNQQSGFPGNVLEPFVLTVNDGETPAPGVSVSWTIQPAGSGELMEGSRTAANGEARASNQLKILKGGVITVTAKVETGSEARLQQRANGSEPNTAVFTINSGFEGSADLNPNQRAVGKSMDTACPALADRENLTSEQQDLLSTCETLQSSSPGEIAVAIARLTPEEVFAMGTATIDTADIQVTNVQSRINAIRLGSAGLDLSYLNMELYGQRIPGMVAGAVGDLLAGQGGGGAGDGDGRLGVFVNGSFAFGTLDESDKEMGLDFDTRGLTVGVDYRTDGDWVFGGALGFVSHSGDFSSEGGSLDLTGTSLSAFATWYEEDAYFDAILSVGQNSFDVKRRINLPGQPDQFAKGSPDASELSLSIGAGLEYSSDTWQFGPYGRLSFTTASVDSYEEQATNSSAAGTGSVLSFKSQTLDSSSIIAGGQISRTISGKSGVWIPQLRLELEHKLDDSKREIDATFLHDPTSTTFTIESEEIDTDYLNIGTGISAVLRNGKSVFLFYETRLGQDRLTQNWIKAGIRFEF